MTLGENKPRSDVRLPPAPTGHFRVIGWTIDAANRYNSWIEDEFPDRNQAKACADALMVAGAYSAAVFNDRGRRTYVRSASGPDFDRTVSVTRLAGQKDPKPHVGSYRR